MVYTPRDCQDKLLTCKSEQLLGDGLPSVRLDQLDVSAEHGHAWGHNNKLSPTMQGHLLVEFQGPMAFLGVVVVRPFHGGFRKGRPVPEAID